MDILDQFRRTAERATLKYAAGQQMFCPKCQRVLDAKRTVHATRTDTNACLTFCVLCWDRWIALHGDAAKQSGVTLETLDGRALWPKRTKGAK